MRLNISEINDSPIYYCGELIKTKENTQLLYQYGPMLITDHLNYFVAERRKIKNDILLYIMDAVSILLTMIEYGNTDLNGREAKTNIRSIIKQSLNSGYKRSNIIANIGRICIQEIPSLSIGRNTASESVIMNCTPIVGYGGHLVKSEISDIHTGIYSPNDVRKIINNLDHLIDMYLDNYIMDILLNSPKVFFDDYDTAKQLLIKYKYESHDDIITRSEKYTIQYYLAIYLKYALEDEEDTKRYFKLINVCNKLFKWEMVSSDDLISLYEDTTIDGYTLY